MPHKACHFSIKPISRGDGKSSVAAAAYRAAARLRDVRTGRIHNYTRKSGVLSVEMIGWWRSAESLWQAAEAAETRRNARVAREILIALPHELPLERQVRLVRGYCLWLRDTYGIASMAAIHAPDRRGDQRNVHVHILATTRVVDPATGEFGEKVHVLDRRKTGPEEVTRCRQEWQKRANAELAKAGVAEKVDLRSYEAQAAAGEAPDGLVPQDHLGPKWTALSRRMTTNGVDRSVVGRRRAKRRERNDEMVEAWLTLRALRRAEAREKASAEIAAGREAERRRQAEAERTRIAAAATQREREQAMMAASQLHATAPADPMAQAIAAARGASSSNVFDDPDEPEIDLEAPSPSSGSERPQARRERPRERER